MTEAHLARQDQDKFHSRADAVFGALNDPSAAAPAWSLSKQLVYRAGRAEAYSSDEEQEAEANEQARQEVTGDGLAKFQDREVQDVIKPSEAFCGAIDREDEFDALDAVALASGETVLPQHVQDGGDLAGEAVEASDDIILQPSRSKKPRVSFAAGTAMSKVQQPRQRSSGTASTSRVPDHVKNPGSYTCYTLDEPVWVGGSAGGAQQPAPGQAAQQGRGDADSSMAKAVPALPSREPEGSAAAAPPPMFQPRQRRQGTASAGAALPRPSGLLALTSDVVDDADDGRMDVDQVKPSEGTAQAAAKRTGRSIRRKPVDDS